MTHANEPTDYWVLVGEHVARLLVRNGAWQGAVFLGREAPVEDEEIFPNICVYVNDERTRDKSGDMQFTQELRLKIEVRERRQDTIDNDFPAPDGLPNHPALGHPAERRLGQATRVIKDLLIAEFSDRSLDLEGEPAKFDPILECNTEIARSVAGEVPHIMASIDLVLSMKVCYERAALETCPLTGIFGQINYTVCREGGALQSNNTLTGAIDAPAC
jgi:hypothetical protein